MKEIFEQIEAEVEQIIVDKKCVEIKRTNLLIKNENLLVECLSNELLYSVMNVVNTVSRFSELHDAYTVEQARKVELEAEKSKLKHKIKKDDHSEMIKHFSNLEIYHLNLQLKYQNLREHFGNNKSQTSQDTPEFDSFFKINKMKEQLQGKNNTIRKLKEQISHINERRSEADRTLDFKALDSQNIELTEHVTALQEQNERFRVENEKVKQHYNGGVGGGGIGGVWGEDGGNERCSEADRTLDFKALDSQNIELIEHVTALQEQNERFRVENEKVKQHYKELYDSIKITCAKTIGKTSSLLTKNEKLKAQLKGEMEYVTMNTVKPKVLAPGRTDRPLVFGLRMLKTYDGESLTAQEFHEKVHQDSQFCDSDLEVAFRKHSCYVRDVDGVELLKGSRGSNLYTISVEDMMKSSPICLLSKASKNKSWLWHRQLNHLNFGTINDLTRKDLVRGLPRLKFEKDLLCSACRLGKSKKYTHKPKSKNNIMEVLHTLHMDLCGPIRMHSINGKKYILVNVDDYSRFTWVKFLRSKDKTPEFVIKFLKQIHVGLNKTVRYIRTDNGKEFVNQVLTEFYESVGISYQKSVLRTPRQNGIVERQNRTLVVAARTMLIFSKALMFLWAEVVATACYTQNRSLIHTRHNKTPYELVHGKKPDLTFLRIFGALCYPTNDSEDLGKLKAKEDIGIFVGYAPNRKGYRIYNKRTRRIMEKIHVQFDELTEYMALVHISSGPGLILMKPGQITSGIVDLYNLIRII
ncbi:retrovirus-related pol polyprotein from transposon TNT 1-94 [Tanacetum coccineum]